MMVDHVNDSSIGALGALMMIISDPAKHQAALDQLSKAHESAASLMEAVREAQRNLDAQKTNLADESDRLEKAKNKLADDEAGRQALWNDKLYEHESSIRELSIKQKQLTDHEAFVAKKHSQIAEYEKAVMTREKAIAQRERSLSEVEDALKAREAKLQADAASVASLRDDVEARLAQLRAIATEPVRGNFAMNAESGSLGSSFSGGR